MTQAVAETRPYSVRACHRDRHHARVVEEASFEAAAVAYLEDVYLPLTDDLEISVIVEEVRTGREHCFRVDLDSGETAPGGEVVNS